MTNSTRDRIAAAFDQELATSPVPPGLRESAVRQAVAMPREDRQPSQIVAVVAAVLAIALVVTLVLTHLRAAPPIPAKPSAPPSSRSGASVVYDPAHGQMVLFGGQNRTSPPMNETWTWDGRNWTLHKVSASPPARTGALMSFDEKHGVAVLFGGWGTSSGQSKPGELNDTWTWDGRNWIQQHPLHTPALALGWPGAMAFDPASRTIVLYGSGSTSTLDPQTWSWNGADWTRLTPAASPQSTGSMFSDGNHAYLLSAPVMPVAGRYVNQTWRWDGDTWTPLPLRRDLPASAFGGTGGLAFDAQRRKAVLFTGDTWTWDGSAWTREHPRTQPKSAGYMTYFAPRHEVVSWGEIYGSSDNAMWAWDGANWTLLQAGTENPAPSPSEGKGGIQAGPMTPDAAAAMIRQSVITESPVLLPSWVPAGLEATVWVGPDGYSIRYQSDQRDIIITWGIVVPNPPPAMPNSGGGAVKFRGVTAEYRVLDKTAEYSSRWLMWSEPGKMANYPTKSGQVPFFLTADGLTDAEFWQLANSLK